MKVFIPYDADLFKSFMGYGLMSALIHLLRRPMQ